MSSTRTTPAVALEATGLGMRYGRRGAHALDGCTFRLPAGRVSALVGPNGAGKSTLLRMAAGLLRPTSGTLTVFGAPPGELRERVSYLGQDKPLYPRLTVAETLRLGAELNPVHWDAAHAAAIVEQGALDPALKVRELSGGQRTRVALALALGKRPGLLLLDEPMADLDPLARHELMGTLMADAAEHGTTVLMSSHIVSELADACDHLLLLNGGRIRLGGGIDDLLAAHTLVTGRGTPADLAPHTVVESRATGRGLTALIRREGPVAGGWVTEEPSLEELLLAHLRSPGTPALLTPGTTVTTTPQAVTA
ncbi:ABC transporter ATP-binding protein [Streptomyces sp. 7R007]